MSRTFIFDGEKIKETQTEMVKKHSPKDIIESIDNARAQIAQMEQQSMQLAQQKQTNDNNIKAAKAFEKDLTVLEEQCMAIQAKHIIERIETVKQEYTAKAKKDAEDTIAKDPSAYDKNQVENLPYLNYQKLLGTDIKIAEKASKRAITEYLYNEPVFENPFKKD